MMWLKRLLALFARPQGPGLDLGTFSRMAPDVLHVARDCIGMGESSGNNAGPDIERFRTNQFTGKRHGGDGPWCAAFVSYVIERACKRMLMEMPFKRSHSARKLWRSARSVGVEVLRPRPGDLVLWKRKGGHHIGIVWKGAGSRFIAIEGNKGRFSSRLGLRSKVAKYAHEMGEPDLIGFARLP